MIQLYCSFGSCTWFIQLDWFMMGGGAGGPFGTLGVYDVYMLLVSG